MAAAESLPVLPKTAAAEVDMEVAIAEAAKAAGVLSLKGEQQRAVKAFAEGSDVFVALPTGYGKSLIYGILPGVFDLIRGVHESIILVVSPLVGLMTDQVEAFQAKGIPAIYASDKDTLGESSRLAIERGEYKIIFISPETLFRSMEWKRILCTEHYRSNLVGFIVDEAHCVKKW